MSENNMKLRFFHLLCTFFFIVAKITDWSVWRHQARRSVVVQSSVYRQTKFDPVKNTITTVNQLIQRLCLFNQIHLLFSFNSFLVQFFIFYLLFVSSSPIFFADSLLWLTVPVFSLFYFWSYLITSWQMCVCVSVWACLWVPSLCRSFRS